MKDYITMLKKFVKAYKYILLISLFTSYSFGADHAALVVSPDGPIATLEAARLEVRKLKKQQPGQPIEVLIKGGTYALRETVVFSPEDSGTEEAPVVYKAFPGEKPVFTGGVKIENWKKVETDPEGVSNEARGNLWVAKIPKHDDQEWYIRTLYDGETLLKRASAKLGRRKPDQPRPFDYNTHGIGIFRDKPLEFEGPLLKPFDRHICFRDNDLRDWENLYDIEMVLIDRPWLSNIIPLQRVDVKNKVAYLSVDPTYQPNDTRSYWIENAIDYLDEPGEWVVNTKKGKIYMWPEEDISEMNVIAPLVQEFIRVEGMEEGPFVRHIHFEGLTFMHGLRDTLVEGDKGLQHDWEMYDKGNAVIRFRFAEDCKFNSNVIKSSSGTGIRLDLHCQRIEIASNHLKYLGGGGIVLSGYGPGTKDVNKNNVVHDNYIHHIGELLWHSAGIFITQSGNNEITHNTIRDLPYNGIVVCGWRTQEFYLVKRIPFRRAWMSSIRVEECMPYILKGLESDKQFSIDHFLPLLHARENKIIMNDISRVLLKLHDGNAIYFSADGGNTLVERNYMHQNYGTAGALRLDADPTFTIIRDNVITESERGLCLKGPVDLINNFIFTETFLRGHSKPGWLGGTKKALPKRNIFMPPASSTSINGLYLTDKRATNRPFYKNLPKMENSIYFTKHTRHPYVPKTELGTDLFSGQPVDPGKDPVKLLYADPMFDEESMKLGLYRFKEGSPAEKLGIQPIDLREVGSSLAQKDFSGLDAKALAAGPRVLFDFANGTPFDQAAIDAQMTVDDVTMTTVDIIDSDGVTEGSTTTIHAGMNALGIVSASGKGDHESFDVGEAWVVQFDTNITSMEISFAGLDNQDVNVFTLSYRDGADDFSTKISGSNTRDGSYILKQSIPAGTSIRIELTAGNISRIQSISVTTATH